MGRLHDRMEQDLKLKNVSPATRKIHLMYARKFVAHYGRPPTELGDRQIRLYLLHLIEVEDVSHGTYRQCLNGTFPHPVPHVRGSHGAGSPRRTQGGRYAPSCVPAAASHIHMPACVSKSRAIQPRRQPHAASPPQHFIFGKSSD